MIAPQQLQRLLGRALVDRPDRQDVDRLFQAFHALAIGHLDAKRRYGASTEFLHGLSTSDLALDCLADLFRRDDIGCLYSLRERYERMNWSELEVELLFTYSRRLVSRKVEDGLFRVAKSVDPGLSRLIRTLKAHATDESGCSIVRRAGTLWITLDNNTPAEWGASMPREVLEARLRLEPGDPSGAEALRAVVSTLKEQDLFAKALPLTTAAIAVRSCIVRRVASCQPQDEQEVTVSVQELVPILEAALESTRSRVSPRYRKAGYEEHEIASILNGAAAFVRSEYDHTQVPGSQFEFASAALPTLTRDAYRDKYRYVFEYVVRLIRKGVVQTLRADAMASEYVYATR
ncbi:MAG: hypothetical protein HKN29_14270 [Rhodothermales bacterium]|nr:hypothetical protein [Rhodothermales bacterium]